MSLTITNNDPVYDIANDGATPNDVKDDPKPVDGEVPKPDGGIPTGGNTTPSTDPPVPISNNVLRA